MLDGEPVSVTGCLRAAGYDVKFVGKATAAQKAPAGGWQDAQLHALMESLAQAPLSRPDWALHLLGAPPRSADPTLLGWMFDRGDDLPREGWRDLRRHRPGAPLRRSRAQLVQTTVRTALGHALNLEHSFDPSVGRPDSTSVMNYDWRYRGGGHIADYWNAFRFTFDAEELAFLRHGRLPDTVPGGSIRESALEWTDLAPPRLASKREPSRAAPELTLTPPAGGALLAHGQPVFLGVTLRHAGRSPLLVPPDALDVKTGRLRIYVRRRRHGGARATEPPARFRPLARRCRYEPPTVHVALRSGETLRANLQLTCGAQGFPFAEPGEYEVFAAVDVATADGAPLSVTTSSALRLRVAAPMTMEEEREALVLLRPDVGLYFALGGSDVLRHAEEDLGEVVARRGGTRRVVTDPVSVCALARGAQRARGRAASARVAPTGRSGGRTDARTDRRTRMRRPRRQTAAQTRAWAPVPRAVASEGPIAQAR